MVHTIPRFDKPTDPVDAMRRISKLTYKPCVHASFENAAWLHCIGSHLLSLNLFFEQVAVAMNNIAALHGWKANYEEALQIQRRCIEIEQHSLGHYHPQV